MKRLGIDNVTDSYPSEISGGEYRRVLLARVLLLDTEILLVDGRLLISMKTVPLSSERYGMNITPDKENRLSS